MQVIHIYGWELTTVLLDNLILLLWTTVFTCLGYVGGRVHGALREEGPRLTPGVQPRMYCACGYEPHNCVGCKTEAHDG